MSDYDYNRWVLNSEYYSTVSRYNNAERRIRQADSEVRHQRARLSNANDNISRVQSEVYRDFSRKLEKESDKLSGQLINLNQELHRDINEMRRKFDAKIDEVTELAETVASRVDEMDEKVEDLSQMVADSINSIAARIDDQKSRSAFYVHELNTYISYILSLNPDKLAPDKFSLITDAYNDAMGNIENQDYEAAISRAQEGISLSVALSSELEILNEKYSLLIEEIEQITSAISGKIEVLVDSEKSRSEVDVKDGTIAFDGRVSFWSNGILDAIVDEYEGKLEYVNEECAATMNIEGLEQIKPEIESVDGKLDSCKDIAFREFATAYYVQVAIQEVHQVLVQNEMLTLIHSGYDDDDPRKPYLLRYKDGNKHEVVVVLFWGVYEEGKKSLGKKPDSKVQIILNVSDPVYNNQQMCEVLFSSLVSRLESQNIHVSNISTDKQGTNSDDFTKQTVSQGNRIKEERVLRERQALNLE